MKNIKLKSLNLKNFKGIREFSLVINGQNASVFGDNGTGKTTIFDSFTFLLFDKDSQNKKDFSLKTLDMFGNEFHGLEHEVEATFIIDDAPLTLRKVFTEKWTKKRGSATSEFTGHTTDYFIDGVPSKKKEFTDLVDSIIKEDIFKLLTSPSYFNEQVKWQDRRKTLLELCGDISIEEVVANNHSLAKLPTILQGRTIENHRKVIAARRAEINKELEKIPVRIDEIQRGLPQLDGLNKSQLEAEVNKLNTEIDELMTQINNIRNGKAISDKQRAIQEIEIELLQIRREHDATSRELMYDLKSRIQEEQSLISIFNSKLENIKNGKRFNDNNIESIENELTKLRAEWHEVNAQEFSHNEECACPTCGQDLPEEQVNAAREKALSDFNLVKSRNLEDINTRGKLNKERKEHFLSENEKLANEYESLKEKITDRQSLLDELNAQLQEKQNLVTDIIDNPSYAGKLKEKQKVEDEIKQLRDDVESSILNIETNIRSKRMKRDQLQGELGKFATAEQSQLRIEELSDQERKLAEEFEKLEQELYLTEEFIRTKVNLLEDKINSKFEYARFKLFETQINGGLQETCVTTYEGVPYNSGLNNAAKINVGLDIISTLSKHYGYSAPIFVDNAEAVTQLIDMDTQVISLVVSEKDKELRVETKSKEMKEAI